jgi:hypothetical protein
MNHQGKANTMRKSLFATSMKIHVANEKYERTSHARLTQQKKSLAAASSRSCIGRRCCETPHVDHLTAEGAANPVQYC